MQHPLYRAGAWNAETGVNAPLHDQNGSPDLSVHGCVKNWEAGGAPREKMNIGFPFYGRSFTGATGLYQPHSGVDDSTWHQDEGIPQFYNIHNLLSTMIQVRDEQTMTQIAYFSTGNMVSYDDERAICDKTQYAMDNGLLGYIIWELSGDLTDDLNTPLLDAANAKLVNPSLDCADIGSYHTVEAAAGGEAAVETEYYPHYDSGTCLSDGLAPSWLQNSAIFNNVNDCCTNNFPWSTDCVAKSTPAPAAGNGKIFYPATDLYGCKSDGKQPPYMSKDLLFKNEEDCCKYHFSWIAVEDCISNGITATATTIASTTTATTTAGTTTAAMAASTTTAGTTTTSTTAAAMAASTTTAAGTTTASTTAAAMAASASTAASTTTTAGTTTTTGGTAATTKAPTDQLIPVEAEPIIHSDQSTLFFPLFESGITKCQNEGTPTIWLSVNDFKGTLSDCCRTYASNYDDCMTVSTATDQRYYPDFQTMSCLNEKEGKPGDWMTEDYFRWTEKRCCRSFFATAQSSSCSDLL